MLPAIGFIPVTLPVKLGVRGVTVNVKQTKVQITAPVWEQRCMVLRWWFKQERGSP